MLLLLSQWSISQKQIKIHGNLKNWNATSQTSLINRSISVEDSSILSCVLQRLMLISVWNSKAAYKSHSSCHSGFKVRSCIDVWNFSWPNPITTYESLEPTQTDTQTSRVTFVLNFNNIICENKYQKHTSKIIKPDNNKCRSAGIWCNKVKLYVWTIGNNK